jgi:hypothetical protein
MRTVIIWPSTRGILARSALTGLAGLYGCSSSADVCDDFTGTVEAPPSEPTVTVKDAATGKPICDAVIQILGGKLDSNPSGPAIMTPTNMALGPWIYAETGPHFPENQLGPFMTCQYGNSVDLAYYGAYTLLVTKVGYQSVEVSNVLVVSATFDACGNSTAPAPPSQIVSVALTPLGS